MTFSHRACRVAALGLVALLLASATPLSGAQTTSSGDGSGGVLVEYKTTLFNDTLFAAVDAAFRVIFDDDGDVWYSTEAGVVHVDVESRTRELITRMDGLPSSYSMGLAQKDGRVFVATDLGLGIVDAATGTATPVTPLNSPLPDQIVQEATVIGDDLWLGTRFYGVAVWNTTKDWADPASWTFHNTSTVPDQYARPVRRIVATEDSVWVATDGDGAWRQDRATGEWSVLLQPDGLASRTVFSVAARGDDEVWFGTDRGVQRHRPDGATTQERWTLYNASKGMPDERVLDLDMLRTQEGTLDVFASTREGVWQLEPASGRNLTRTQSFGLLGIYVLDMTYSADWGWAFATNRGISLLRNGEWTYYTTGASEGVTAGPLSFGFTSASVGDSGNFLWFGSSTGVSAYRLPTATEPGYWQNFGPWQNYPGGPVNWIDTENGVTWIGTNSGTYGFEHDTGRWIPKLAVNSRNLVYSLEADRGELWVALFGDGLLMTNLTTGVSRTWDLESVPHALPDTLLTDIRADGETIWLGSSIGVTRLDRATGAVLGTYTASDGLPGRAVIFRVLPEGPVVWVGTKDDGVGKLDVATGKASRVWNATTSPGWPEGQTRSMLREGGRLWVGTTQGLVRLDVTTGEFRVFNQSNSDLVQNYVNGISHADGILYLATLSGVARLDIATETFLPMRDGPGVVRTSGGATGTAGDGSDGSARPSVRILGPRDGGAVTGLVEIHGSAAQAEGAIDRVEVRIGAGDWQAATGTSSWSFAWDASAHPANEPVTIAARAWSGVQASREVEILVTPVAAPETPLAIDPIAFGHVFAGRDLQVAARAQGDEPLKAYLHYKPDGAAAYATLELTRQGGLFVGSVPGRDVREGTLTYYFEARSGLLSATAPERASEPRVVQVVPQPSLGVSIEGPAGLRADAGKTTPFELTVTNVGTQAATFVVSASGPRASWATLPDEPLALAPGASEKVSGTLSVPPAAFADNTTLTFQARDVDGVAQAASASVPVEIVAAQSTGAAAAPAQPTVQTPLPPVVALLALVGVALVARRWRQ